MRMWDDECTRFILGNGYENEKATFLSLAFEIKNRGFVYCLFDADMINSSNAKKYVLNYNYV